MISLLQSAGFEVEETVYQNRAAKLAWRLNSKLFNRNALPAAQSKIFDRLVYLSDCQIDVTTLKLLANLLSPEILRGNKTWIRQNDIQQYCLVRVASAQLDRVVPK